MSAELPKIADVGHPAEVVNVSGKSSLLLVCEHASKHIPHALGTLGLSEGELSSHIAWDIGAEQVARRLSDLLDATLILQRYSRLIYDCNRPPDAASAIPAVSELTEIPGNSDLPASDRQARIDEIYEPFHELIASIIESKQPPGGPLAVVSIHSFTPTYKGTERPFELGVLHDEDTRLADALLCSAAGSDQFESRRNEPYGPEDGVLHTLNLHCKTGRLKNMMLEIRNDVIADTAGQKIWSKRLGDLLQDALVRSAEIDVEIA